MQTYKVYLMGVSNAFNAENLDNLRKNLIKKYPMEISDLGMKIKSKNGNELGILTTTVDSRNNRPTETYMWIYKSKGHTRYSFVNPKTGKTRRGNNGKR